MVLIEKHIHTVHILNTWIKYSNVYTDKYKLKVKK